MKYRTKGVNRLSARTVPRYHFLDEYKYKIVELKKLTSASARGLKNEKIERHNTVEI